MALQEVTASFLRRFRTQAGPVSSIARSQCLRHASTDAPATQEAQDLEETGFASNDPESAKKVTYDPLHRSRSFKGRLPPSRYTLQARDPSNSN